MCSVSFPHAKLRNMLFLTRSLARTGHVARMGDRRGANRVLVGKPEGRRLLERPRRRWENNIKIDLREVGPEHGLDRSGLGYGQVAGSCECGNKHSYSIK